MHCVRIYIEFTLRSATAQAGCFYIFNSRSYPENLFIRYPLEPTPRSKLNGVRAGTIVINKNKTEEKYGSVFDIKGDAHALYFNEKLEELYNSPNRQGPNKHIVSGDNFRCEHCRKSSRCCICKKLS